MRIKVRRADRVSFRPGTGWPRSTRNGSALQRRGRLSFRGILRRAKQLEPPARDDHHSAEQPSFAQRRDQFPIADHQSHRLILRIEVAAIHPGQTTLRGAWRQQGCLRPSDYRSRAPSPISSRTGRGRVWRLFASFALRPAQSGDVRRRPRRLRSTCEEVTLHSAWAGRRQEQEQQES